jgi:hypothetical protein
MALLGALCFVSLGYAGTENGDGVAKRHHHRHPFIPYLSQTQLNSLSALNLNEPAWRGFWKGVSVCQRTTAKAQVAPPSDPSSLSPEQKKEHHKQFFTALKAAFSGCFSSQLTASNSPSPSAGN